VCPKIIDVMPPINNHYFYVYYYSLFFVPTKVHQNHLLI
jgi:hypothetical protein